MVKIRLRRTGARNNPHYRVVAADARAPRDGGFLERLGYYNPVAEPPQFSVNEERVLHWLKCGAQPSQPVSRLLEKAGILKKLGAKDDR